MVLKDWKRDFSSKKLIAWNKKGTEKDLFVQKGDLILQKGSDWRVIIKNQDTNSERILKKFKTKSQAISYVRI